jgi:hypothetical protein
MTGLFDLIDPVAVLRDGKPDEAAINKLAKSLVRVAGRATPDRDQGRRGGDGPVDMNALKPRDSRLVGGGQTDTAALGPSAYYPRAVSSFARSGREAFVEWAGPRGRVVRQAARPTRTRSSGSTNVSATTTSSPRSTRAALAATAHSMQLLATEVLPAVRWVLGRPQGPGQVRVRPPRRRAELRGRRGRSGPGERNHGTSSACRSRATRVSATRRTRHQEAI